MNSQMSFDLSPALAVPIIMGLLIPAFLLIVTRISSLSGRNPIQFLIAVLIAYGLWVFTGVIISNVFPTCVLEGVAGFMAIAICALFYLEVWGLLSRGYTLGILLTLYKSSSAMTSAEIASAYRGGDGLDWIVYHRITGLEASGMLHRQDDRLVLTPFPGMCVAIIYKLSVKILGLRQTG